MVSPRFFLLAIFALTLLPYSLPSQGLFSGADAAPLPAPTAGVLTLTLDQAIARALDESLDLQRGYIDLQTAGYSASRLWAQVFPDLSLSGGLGYRSAMLTDPGLRAEQNNFTYNASLGISIQLAPSLAYTMRILSLAYQTQLLNYATLCRQAELQVAKTFYSLLAIKESISILLEMQNLAEQQYQRNQIAFASGLISQRTLLQSYLGAETARLNYAQGYTGYRRQLGEFLVLLGLDQATPVELEGVIAASAVIADAEDLIQRHLPKRPDIVAQRQTIERLELTRNRTVLTSRSPSLTLSTQWQGNGPMGGDFTDSLSGSLTVRVPLEGWIPGTVASQSIRSANGEVEKAKLDLQRTESRARMEIRSLVENLRNSWEYIAIARLRVEIAELGYALSEQGFSQGTVESLALEDARNSMAQARQQLLEGELAYILMALDLAAALNADEL